MEYFAYTQRNFVYKYVVTMIDTDQFEHMSFANYLKLMFLATDALFLSASDPRFFLKNRVGLVNSRMQFRRQSSVGEKILIQINSVRDSGPNFSLIYTYVIEGKGDVVALARQTYQLLAGGTRSESLPPVISGLLESIQVDEEHLLYRY